MLSDLQKVAQGASLIKLQTTVGDGAHDVWVDTPQVPAGKVRSYLNASILGDTVNTGGRILHCFVCEPNMAPNSPPLLPNGLINFSRVGCRIGGPGGANPTVAVSQLIQSVAFGIGGGSQAFGVANTKGNWILVLCQAARGGTLSNPNASFSISDTNGNKYKQIGSTIFSCFTGGPSAFNSAAFLAYNIKPGANTVTMTVTGMAAGATLMDIMEGVGGGNLNPLVDFGVEFNNDGVTTKDMHAHPAVNQPNQLVVLYYGSAGAPGGWPPAGYTNPINGACYNNLSIGTYSYTFGSPATLTQAMWNFVLTNVVTANPLATGGSNRRAPIMLHENQFLRFMTGNVAAGAPPAGTTFDISLVYSDMDVCEVCP